MKARSRRQQPLERAWGALVLIGEPIEYDEVYGEATGVEEVEAGLDAMASALSDFRKLGSSAYPLDEVLARLGAKPGMIETAASLIEYVGRASYAGGLGPKQVKRAERLREKLEVFLDDLLTSLQSTKKHV